MSVGGPAPTRSATAARVVRRLGTTIGHRMREGVHGSRPVAAHAVPGRAEQLTPDWLTAALCGDVPGARVTRVELSGASSQTTSRAGLRITYDDAGREAGLPERVFAKLTATVRQRLFLGLIRIVDGEPRFYRDLRPLLDIECPQGYHGAVDPRSWRSVVLMEDIAAMRGAEFCHATTNVDRRGAESLVRVLARCHGTMWDAAGTRPELAGLKLPIDHFHNVSAFLDMRTRCAVGIERSADVVPPTVRDASDALWDAFVASMRRCSTGPLTLLHGDPHVGNTYRLPNGRMAFADWQVVMRGSWSFDIAYALSTALTIEDRRAWERDLLALYLDELGAAGGEAPTAIEAWDAYRGSLMYPLHTWLTVIGRSRLQPEMQPDDVSRIIIGRVATAIDDLAALRVAT